MRELSRRATDQRCMPAMLGGPGVDTTIGATVNIMDSRAMLRVDIGFYIQRLCCGPYAQLEPLCRIHALLACQKILKVAHILHTYTHMYIYIYI